MATVSPAAATGKVTYYNGTVVLGTSPVVSGQAAFTTALLPADVQSLTAYYSGNSTYASSTSAVFKQTVTPAAANSFQPVVSYQVNVVAFEIVTGDFNEDGKPDIAVNCNDGGIAILLGNGDGTFQPPVFYTYYPGPGLAAGDFNQDGHTDLAYSGGVLWGNGDGTFNPTAPFPFDVNSEAATSLAVGDFNGDGLPDVVVSFYLGNDLPNQISVILNNGDGTFSAPTNYAANTSPDIVTVADFNGDGKADLAVGDNTGTIQILLGNGDGTFQAPLSMANAGDFFYPSLVAADVNGDGKVDLIDDNQNGGINIFLGNGNGTFQPAVTYGAGLYLGAVAVADIDGNGTLDLVTGGQNNFFTVLLGKGDGTFQVGPSYEAGNSPNAAIAADFNGDGRTDLAFAATYFGVGDDLAYMDVFLASSAQATGTILSSSLNPSTFSQSVTLSAAVTPATATGTITFSDGVTFLGASPVSGGAATYTSDYLAAGSHSLRAIYGGDATNASSSSSVLTQTVNESASTTALSSSLNPSVFDEGVTFTATVLPSEASGMVTFLDGSTVLGSASFCCGSATFETSSLAVGSHSITAVSSGSSIFTSSSAPLIQVVNQQATKVNISAAPNPSTVGQAVLITAEVKPDTAVGTVTFRAGTTVLGTVTLNKKGEARLSISTLPEGTHILTAQYAGSTDYKGSTSEHLTQTVN
jgi:hypothetical protein